MKVCLVALLLGAFGCAAHSPAVETSSAQTSAQAEIAALEKKIADRKNSLPGGARSPLQSETQAVPMAAGEAGGRCDGVCQAAEEICICNRRICKLAGEINDEKSAESCRRSQKDCEEAGKSCATCR
jgi:hypothetical protein